MRNLMDDMAVDMPEGALGNVTVERFEARGDTVEELRMEMAGRGCRPGTYTRLLRAGDLWMSDTTAERRDHLMPAWAIDRGAERVLIGGLGLGMILRVALLTPSVEHVDVVDIDPDVIALVGPHYAAMAETRGVDLVFHAESVFDLRWPRGTRWNVAWFDIWEDMNPDVLDEMTPLRRSYGQRADWCDCWGREDMIAARSAWAS